MTLQSVALALLIISSLAAMAECTARRPVTASHASPNSAASVARINDDTDPDNNNNIAPSAGITVVSYGQRTGRGTSEYWGKQALAQSPPPANSIIGLLLSSVAKVLGPIALKYFGRTITLLGSLQPPPSKSRTSAASDAGADATGNARLLLRETVAAFLNSVTVSGFPLSADEVVQSFNSAIGDDDAASATAAQLQLYNEAV